MTYTYTFDNMIVIQQIGSAYIDNATGVEMLRLEEQGWNIDAVHNYPQGDRCYVILSKPTTPQYHCVICHQDYKLENRGGHLACKPEPIKLSPEGAQDIYNALSDLYDDGWHTPLANSSAIWYAMREVSKYVHEKEAYEEIEAQWNLAMPYLAELWD